MEPSIHRLRACDVLVFCVLALLGMGVLMVQSASINVGVRWSVRGQDAGGRPVQRTFEANSAQAATRAATQQAITVSEVMPAEGKWYWTSRAKKHVMFAAIAVITFFAVGHMDYRRLLGRGSWRTPALWILAAGVLTCLLVLVPGIGKEINGARRWLWLGFVQVQPSEIGKWAVVVFLAWWLATYPERADRFFGGFGLLMVPIGAICLLIVIQDFGTAALIMAAALTLMLVSRVRLWHLAVVVPPVLAAGYWFVRHKEYRWRRMTAFVDPFASPRAEGYHMVQSLLSFATGGIFGRGLGNGIQKLGYLPEDTTDFIFAVICEELGLFGAMLTIALYLGILYVVWQAIRQSEDGFGKLLAFGIGSMIGLQALINIAVATVSVPTKGLSLPLVSAGGSGLVITCAALGLLYSVTRHGRAAQPIAVAHTGQVAQPA